MTRQSTASDTQSLGESAILPLDIATLIPALPRPRQAQLRFVGTESTPLSDEAAQFDVDDYIVPPVLVPSGLSAQPRFIALQKWEGRVVSRTESTFGAVVVALRGVPTEEIVEFDLEEITPDDIPMVVEGAVFYWSIGYREERSGERSRSSVIRFRRLPAWSQRDIERNELRVAALKTKLGL